MINLKKMFSIYRENKKGLAYRVLRKTCSSWMPDAMYLKILYRIFIGKQLHLKNPLTYNEKLQWLKLHDHNPLYTTMVDKFAVKQYVASKIGEEYIIPTIGVWDSPEQIDFSILPNQFVLKTTFGGGGSDLIICKDKSLLDIDESRKYLSGYMKQNSYKHLKEWPYKNVPHRIIAEKLLEEPGKESLTDYKVMCFNGVAKLVELHMGRYTGKHTQDFYDRDWHKTELSQGVYGECSDYIVEKPQKFEEMLRLSELLSESIPHVRVDWYIINHQLYFGEMTFFDGSGLCPWDKDEYDMLLGSWIDLSKVDVNN